METRETPKERARRQLDECLAKHMRDMTPQDIDRMLKAALGHPTGLLNPEFARVRVPYADVPLVAFRSPTDVGYVGITRPPSLSPEPIVHSLSPHLIGPKPETIEDVDVLTLAQPRGSEDLACAWLDDHAIQFTWGTWRDIFVACSACLEATPADKYLCQFCMALDAQDPKKAIKTLVWFNRVTGIGGRLQEGKKEETFDRSDCRYEHSVEGKPTEKAHFDIEEGNAGIIADHLWVREEELAPYHANHRERLHVDNGAPTPWHRRIFLGTHDADSQGPVLYVAGNQEPTKMGELFLGDGLTGVEKHVSYEIPGGIDEKRFFGRNGRIFCIRTASVEVGKSRETRTLITEIQTGWTVLLPLGMMEYYMRVFLLHDGTLAVFTEGQEVMTYRSGSTEEPRPASYPPHLRGEYDCIIGVRSVGKRMVLHVTTRRGKGVLIHGGSPHVIPLFGPFDRLRAVKTGNPDKPDEEVIVSWHFGDGTLSLLQFGDPA